MGQVHGILLASGVGMNYQIDFKPRELKDLGVLPEADKRRVVTKIETLQRGLAGNVKKLTHFTPEYRFRVGDYRVLFEIEGSSVVIYRVLHRREAYR